jgi:hypothetical protein
MRRRLTGWTLAALLLLTACTAPSGAPAGSGGEGGPAGTAAMGRVVLTIRPAGAGLQTQAAPRLIGEVASYEAELRRSGDDAVISVAPSVTTGVGTATITFTNVPVGATYYLRVRALNNLATVISKDGWQTSNTVNVTSATTFNVAMTLNLDDGTGGTVTVNTTAPATFTGTRQYAIWLVNTATKAVLDSQIVSTASTVISKVKNGNYDVWVMTIDTTNGWGTPAKKAGTVSIAGDVTTGGSPVTATYAHTINALYTISGANLRNQVTDGAGAEYVPDRLNHTILKLTAGTPTTVIGPGGADGADGVSPAGAVLNRPEGMAVDSTGSIAVGNTLSPRRLRFLPVADMTRFNKSMTGGLLYHLATVSTATSARGIAFDSAGNLFYNDGLTINRIAAADGAVTAVTTTGTATTGLAIDRQENLFVTDGTVVSMVAKTAGTYFGQTFVADEKKTVYASPSSTAARGVAVDPVGNLYVTDINGSNGVLRLVNRINGTAYLLAGGGGGALVDGADPLTVNLQTVWGVSTNGSGAVTLSGTDGTTLWRVP